MDLDITVKNFITVGIMAVIFVFVVKMATKKFNINIGL